MKKLISSIIVIGCIISSAYAQLDEGQSITKTGTSAAQFLKIGVDARATAMGGAFAAIEGDLSAMFWNPAGLGHLKGIGVMFVHSNWLADMNFNHIAFASDLGSMGVIGFSVTSFIVPDDKVRTVEQPNGTGELFNAGDLSVNLAYARRLTDKFSIGGNVKFIQQRIWHESASTFAVDIGALFTTPLKGIRIGASITNFGGNMRMNGRDLRFSKDPDDFNEGNVKFVNALYETDAFPLPLNFRVGISGELIQTDNMRVTFGLDAIHPKDNTESVNAGVEFAFSEMFFLRSGYATLFRQNTEEGLNFGGGIHYRLWGSSTVLKIDYAYADYGLLDYVQRFSLGINF